MGYNIAGLVINDNYGRDISKLNESLGWNLVVKEEITFEQASKNWTPSGQINVYFSKKGTMVFFPHEMAINGYHPPGVASLCYAYSATAMVFLVDYQDAEGNHRSFTEENHENRRLVSGEPIALEEKYPTADGLIFALFDELLEENFHHIDFSDKAYRCILLPKRKQQTIASHTKEGPSVDKDRGQYKKTHRKERPRIDHESRDVRLQLPLTLEDIYYGTIKQLEYQRRMACPQCYGKRKHCDGCTKDGYTIVKHKERIRIPAGVDLDMRMVVRGKGHQFFEVPWGLNKVVDLFVSDKHQMPYKYGDLLMDVEVVPHPYFYRLGNDLIHECYLHLADTITGGHVIELLHLDQTKLKIEIPQGTVDGKILRIKGKGFANLKEKTTGHLLIVVKYN